MLSGRGSWLENAFLKPELRSTRAVSPAGLILDTNGGSLVAVLLIVFMATGQNPVLARFQGGTVTLDELRREESFLAPGELRFNKKMGLTLEQRKTDFIRRIALREIALPRARERGLLEDPLVREKVRESQRRWLLSQWGKHFFGQAVVLPSQRELRRELAAENLVYPSRLRLSHIYIRAQGVRQRVAAVTLLGELRSRAATLREFQALARAHSHSQTAYRGGSLGFLHKGWLPEPAEKLLWTLPEGSVSAPIPLRGGYHIFFVEKNLPQQAAPLEPRLKRLLASRRGEIKRDAKNRALAQIKERFKVSLQPGGPRAWPDVTVGEWSVSGSVLAELYPSPNRDSAQIVSDYIADEKLFQAALASDWPEADQRAHLIDLEGDVLILAVVERELVKRLEPPAAAELRSLVAAEPKKFRKRRALKPRLLSMTFPKDRNPMDFYQRCAEVAADLGEHKLSWDAAVAAIGSDARHESWPFTDVWSLASRLGPPVFERIKKQAMGRVSEPIKDGNRLWIIAVEAEQKARAMTFEEAAPRAEAILIERRRSSLRAEVIAGLLQSYQFQMVIAREEAGHEELPEQ